MSKFKKIKLKKEYSNWKGILLQLINTAKLDGLAWGNA